MEAQPLLYKKTKSVTFNQDIESQITYYGSTKSVISDTGLMRQGSRRHMGVHKKMSQRDTLKGATATMAKAPPKTRQEHSRVYRMLRRHSHRWPARTYRFLVRSLIFVSTVNFILETERYFQHCCTSYFDIFEAVISTFFLIEYILKLATVPERKLYVRMKKLGADGEDTMEDTLSRMHFVMSGESFVDLLSFLPFFVEIAFNINPGKYELVRMLRILRLFKLPMIWDAFRMVSRVLYYNWEILGSALLVCFIMLLACSIMLFYTRPPLAMDHVDNFSSVLACMYLAVLMLTGQGEPDGQLPWYTRVIVSITAIFAIAQFAIPASMLTWGFEQEAEHNIVKNDKRENKVIDHFLGGPFSEDIIVSSSSSDESDRAEEWEAYRDQVCGEESSGSDSSQETRAGDEDDREEKEEEDLVAGKLSYLERKRARQIFKHLSTAPEDALADGRKVKTIKRNIIDKFASMSDDEDEKKLFDYDYLCKRLAEAGCFTDDEESKRKGINRSQFYAWLVHVKTNFPRYGKTIFLRLLNSFEEVIEEKEKKRSEVDGSRAPLGTTQAPRRRPRAGTCAPFISKPQKQGNVATTAAPALSSTQLFGFAEQMRKLEEQKVALQAKIAAMERELLTLKETNA